MRSAVLASAALKRNAAPFANAGLLDCVDFALYRPDQPKTSALRHGALVMEF
jgi:hypothetical protein